MRIIGCDVGAKYIIVHDGDKAVEISTPLEAQAYIRPNDIVVLEQTGAYGIRWAEVFSTLGAKIYIADGRDFKNYRLAHSRKKDDSLDAFYLRRYYQEKPNKCRPYNPMQTHIRALIRQHIRNQKDITTHTNRLKQYLAMIYPTEENHLKHRKTLYNHLDQLITRLKQTPHALSPLAISEAQKLQVCLTQAKQLEEEITSIARNHPDYEVLKTFPLGDLQIATLLAYSWDIKDFKDKEGYIAYVLMGANLEQSGTSIYKIKTDKARTEIKGIYYMLFMKAHQKTHPLHPLARLSKELINAKHNYKKRSSKSDGACLRTAPPVFSTSDTRSEGTGSRSLPKVSFGYKLLYILASLLILPHLLGLVKSLPSPPLSSLCLPAKKKNLWQDAISRACLRPT
ncbi:MAG: transposase [Candidatus Bathyarchaeia archaeon]